MMSDVICPYCGSGQEINHDDGAGYAEDCDHEQRCNECCKDFKFTTSISYDYEVFCTGEHELEQCEIPKHRDLWNCNRCDYYEVRS